jgi:glycosyltransferase involved in cell wall biosynthesis
MSRTRAMLEQPVGLVPASGRPPRLLFLATVPVTLRSFLFPYARHFRSLGWRVDGAAAGASACERCREEFDHVYDIPWSRDPLRPSNLTHAPRVLRHIVASGEHDLVHVTTPVAAFVARYALRARRGSGGPRLIYTAQGFHFHRLNPAPLNLAFRTLERLAGRWTDQLVVVNREDHLAAKRHRLVPPDRLSYMPGIGIDLAHYGARAVSPDEVAAVRRELSASATDRIFLMVAELSRRKRPADAVLALQRLARSNVRLALAGDGPLQRELAERVERLGLGGRVLLLGRRPDVPRLMRASVATVLTSRQEGLPRVVKESMALGTPVIGTRIRGTEELLEDGCGLLFDVGDVEQLTQHMASVLDDPEAARTRAAKARDKIEAYDEPILVRLHEELYARALARPTVER